MNKKVMLASLALTAGLIAATPAQASYMAKCNALISAWEKCRATGAVCKVEHQQIVEQCKCHRLRQGKWKLVMAAVGKDGVCAPRPTDEPEDPSPPPYDPPTRPPVTTYGGERGPAVGRDGPWHSDDSPGRE